MTGQIDSQLAHDLLERANSAEATARAGASWPQVAGLLGIGAASSLAIVALAYVPATLIWLPMGLLFVWFGALLAFASIFGRSVKRGFGRRWLTTIILWGITWAVSTVGASWLFAGRVWFVVVASTTLSAITLAGAWVEASR